MPSIDSAPGIPSRSVFGDLTRLAPGTLADFTAQMHKALRAGPHVDLRLGLPETGHFSWAVRKGLPRPGQKHLAVLQPLHDPEWAKFEGVIPKGLYGAGEVSKLESGQALLTKITPDEAHFTLAHRGTPQRMALIRSNKDPKKWLLLNTTPTKPIPYSKTKYKSVPAEQAEDILSNLQPGSSVQAKIDGAAALTSLARKHVDVASYRTSVTGEPIVHTERVFGHRPPLQIPAALAGTILRGELYGVRKGKAIPPQELGGLLNAAISRSLQRQRERGIELRNLIFDVQQLGKKPISPETPYAERLQMVRDVLKYLPPGRFHAPEEARTPEAALKLWRSIIGGKHPLTREGVIVHPPTGKPTKIKQREETDVIITGFAPGKGKYAGKGIGAFTYAHPDDPTKTVGEVGTGLSDELRREMFRNPKEYLGRTAKVIAQEKLPSGALRSPALLSLHEDVPARLSR